MDLWGFSSRTYHADGNLPYDRKWQDQDGNGTKESYPLPDQKYIDAFRRLTDFDGVEVFEKDGQYFVKKTCHDVTVDGVNYSQWIDLGGIAKGYAADLADDIIVKYGYDKGYVNVGTSSFTFLQYSDEKGWDLDLQDPFNGWSSYASLEISDAVLSTSGQYVRKYTTDGVEYSHIIDASTGRPAQTGIVTVTTIGGSAAEDDCLTTALTVMGLDKAVEFINGDYFAENKLDVSLVYDGGMVGKTHDNKHRNIEVCDLRNESDTVVFQVYRRRQGLRFFQQHKAFRRQRRRYRYNSFRSGNICYSGGNHFGTQGQNVDNRSACGVSG